MRCATIIACSIFEPKAVLTDNIWGYLWGKLGYGSLLFATALTNASMSENLASERHFTVYHRLGQEVMAVAKARGVKPSVSTASTRTPSCRSG